MAKWKRDKKHNEQQESTPQDTHPADGYIEEEYCQDDEGDGEDEEATEEIEAKNAYHALEFDVEGYDDHETDPISYAQGLLDGSHRGREDGFKEGLAQGRLEALKEIEQLKQDLLINEYSWLSTIETNFDRDYDRLQSYKEYGYFGAESIKDAEFKVLSSMREIRQKKEEVKAQIKPIIKDVYMVDIQIPRSEIYGEEEEDDQ